MNHFPKLTLQNLHATQLALYAIRESHRLQPTDRAAIDRVLRIIINRAIDLHNHHQDLDP